MMKYLNRYLFGITLSAFLIVIILIIYSSSSNTSKHLDMASNYVKSNSVAEIYISGPVTATVNHYEVSIAVSSLSVVMNIYQGYDGQVISSNKYPNTYNSYNNFMNALDSVGFTLGANVHSSPIGHCVTGQTYQYQLYDNSVKIQDLWSSNCDSKGTYKGDSSSTFNLFRSQVPDFDDLISKSNISI